MCLHSKIIGLLQSKAELEQVIQHWHEYEEHYDRCSSWIKDAEAQVRSVDLKTTLQDKQETLQKLRVRCNIQTFNIIH